MNHSIVWRSLDSIRLKVTDRCPWNCWWCHNEGTGARNPRKVGDVHWDAATKSAIEALTCELGLNEVHFTGGEPTMNPYLPEVIAGLRGLGLKVKATSIGCNEDTLRAAVLSGLQGLNISMHALDASMLHSTQIDRTLEWTECQLAQQIRTIILARDLGVDVKINTVVANAGDIPRVKEVIRWAERMDVSVSIMNELSSGETAYRAIEKLLVELNAVKLYTRCIAASSSISTYYFLPSNYRLAFKRIRGNYLNRTVCHRCSLKRTERCSERFYGIRLEKRKVKGEWHLYVRLCIHRTDADTLLSVEDFLQSRQLVEIKQQLRLIRDYKGIEGVDVTIQTRLRATSKLSALPVFTPA